MPSTASTPDGSGLSGERTEPGQRPPVHEWSDDLGADLDSPIRAAITIPLGLQREPLEVS